MVLDCSGMCGRVANVGQVDWRLWMLRNGIVCQVVGSRARAGADVRPGRAGLSRQGQRVVDRRLGVASLNLVFPLLQHCGLENSALSCLHISTTQLMERRVRHVNIRGTPEHLRHSSTNLTENLCAPGQTPFQPSW